LFQLSQIVPWFHQHHNMTAHQSTLAFHQYFLFSSGCNFIFQSHENDMQQASPWRPLAISNTVKFFYEEEFVPPRKLCELASFCALYFTATHVIRTLLFLKHTNSMTSCSNSWKCPCLGPMKDFWVELAFVSFYFCCFHLHAPTLTGIRFPWHSPSPLVEILHHNCLIQS
jgi:hypothetical protein